MGEDEQTGEEGILDAIDAAEEAAAVEGAAGDGVNEDPFAEEEGGAGEDQQEDMDQAGVALGVPFADIPIYGGLDNHEQEGGHQGPLVSC